MYLILNTRLGITEKQFFTANNFKNLIKAFINIRRIPNKICRKLLRKKPIKEKTLMANIQKYKKSIKGMIFLRNIKKFRPTISELTQNLNKEIILIQNIEAIAPIKIKLSPISNN